MGRFGYLIPPLVQSRSRFVAGEDGHTLSESREGFHAHAPKAGLALGKSIPGFVNFCYAE